MLSSIAYATAPRVYSLPRSTVRLKCQHTFLNLNNDTQYRQSTEKKQARLSRLTEHSAVI